MSRVQLTSFLRQLADRIDGGSVTRKGDSGKTQVQVGENVEFEVEYETKQKPSGVQYQLELKIEWGSGSSGVGLA